MESELATSWPMANGHSQNLIEVLPAAFYLCNASAVIVSYNRRAAELWGRAPAIGDTDEKYSGSYRMYQPDGTFLPHHETPMAWVLRSGKPVADREVVIERPDGSRITVLVNIAPLFGDDGELVGAANCFQDITTEKQNDAERIRLAEELRQAKKMEALGHLTTGVVHDLNNLLTVILGNLEILTKKRSHDDGALKLLSNAMRSARRGAELNGQLLDFAHKRPLLPKAVDLNQVLGGMGYLFQSMIGNMIEIETRPQPDAWPARVDANQIALVILNLAINARDAMPGGGMLTIETRNVTIAPVGGPDDLAPGDYVALSVRDTGTGMSEEARAKACEPFFTTKGLGRGSGLGLSMASDVAKQFGGDMRIDSKLGEGTTVTVYLPRVGVEALSSDGVTEPVPAIDASVASGQIVLVVDDDRAVREVTAAVIASAGYAVIEAQSGPAALEVLERGEPRVDLAVIDISMPDMSGIEAMRRARQKRPDLPILYLTGHADLARFGSGDIDRSRIVGKPFSRNDLLTRVHACMADRAAPRPANDAEPGTASDRDGSAASL